MVGTDPQAGSAEDAPPDNPIPSEGGAPADADPASPEPPAGLTAGGEGEGAVGEPGAAESSEEERPPAEPGLLSRLLPERARALMPMVVVGVVGVLAIILIVALLFGF